MLLLNIASLRCRVPNFCGSLFFQLFLSTLILSTISPAFQGVAARVTHQDSHLKEPYKDYALFQVFPKNESQLLLLQDLHDSYQAKYDFWTTPARVGTQCDVMVAPEEVPGFTRLMASAGIRQNITEPNVQRLVDLERTLMDFEDSKLRDDRSPIGADGNFRLDRFNSYDNIKVYLRNLEYSHGKIAEVVTAPYRTYEGRYVDGILIGNRQNRNSRRSNRPVLWIDGGAHAREWISPAVALYIIDQLIKEYYTNSTIQSYIDEMDFYILPVINPDGYDYSQNRFRLWRKNRNPNDVKDDYYDACRGVDLNRNFAHAYGGKGSSGDPCSTSYRGTSAFSEPESKNIRAMVQRIGRYRLKSYISLHAYAQLWALPYGHDRHQQVNDPESKRAAVQATRTLKSFYGTRYAVDTSGNYLYPASGAAADWVRSELNTQYTYLIELPPSRDEYVTGFLLSASKIIPHAREMYYGYTTILERVLQTKKNG